MTAVETLGEMESLSDASPRDLSQQQLSKISEMLLSDNGLYYFAWYIFGFKDLVPEIHGKLSALLGKWGSPGYERLMIQIPREFFKTSLCTIANSLWQVARDPDAPIAIFNEKEGNASMWVRTIRDVASSSLLFQALFPDLLPPGIKIGDGKSMPRHWKWNDYEIMFQRDKIQPEASVTALGIGSASAGRHWPKIIKDDLISEDAIRSQAVMEFVKGWFDKSLYLERPATKGWDLIPCTSWGYNDLYAYVLGTYDYLLYRRSALENEDGEPDVAGESIFPSKLSTEELRKQNERDPYGFSSQMQNTPSPGRDRNFDPKWIRWGKVDWKDPERPRFVIRTEDFDPDCVGEAKVIDRAPMIVALNQMNKAILWDPAPTEEGAIVRAKSARNALIAVGVDAWGRKFVLESWASRDDPISILNQAFRMMKKWGTNRLGIEEVNFSKIYRHWIVQEQFTRKFFVNVMKLKPGRMDKGTRITGLIPGHKSRLYYYNYGHTDELVKELVEYPYGATEDCLDALAYDYKVTRPKSPGEEYAVFARTRATGLGRNPVTGY